MLVDHGYEDNGQVPERRSFTSPSDAPAYRIKKGSRRLLRAVAASFFFALQGGFIVADASAVTPTQVGSGLTAPNSGVVLNGGAINPATNLPYRHLWMPDHLSGVCRMDPDLDSPPPYSLNQSTCISLNATLKPGQIAFDATNNNLYTVDLTTKSQGLYRLHFLPNGDSGHGAMDVSKAELITSLAGGCGLGGSVPVATSIGPDGNLYIGFKKGGNITRIKNPGVDPIPCANYQNVGTSGDGKLTLGLGWIGHTLYGVDGASIFSIDKADTCTGSCRGVPLLPTQVVIPSSLITDQTYPATNGGTLYVGTPNTLARINLKTSPMTVEPNYGLGMLFVMGLAVDMSNPASPTLFAADDPTNGAGVVAGRLWRLADPLPTQVPPATVSGVSGIARDGAVVLSWTAGAGGTQPITSYTINSPQWGSSRVETVGIVPPATSAPTSAAITGLANGTGYTFTVTANSAAGSSAPSAVAGPFMPQAAVAPAAPTKVSAVAGNASASLVWSAPALDGNSPITGYRVDQVTADATGNPVYTQVAVAPADATGANVFGLTNGNSYNFVVSAQNVVGFGPPSAPPTMVALSSAPNTDLAISMTGPASVTPGSAATYTATVVNNGPVNASQVVFKDIPPPTGATLVSATSSLGVCNTTTWPITCNLPAMPVRSSATITITLNVNGKISYGATVQALDTAGNAIPDSTPANNSVNPQVVTDIAVATTSTDLQLGGTAKTGGPAKGSSNTYSWQIKNSGKSVANAVVFSNDLPSSLQLNGQISITGATGSCGTSPGSLGTLVTCRIDSLGSAQTMTITENVTVLQSGSITTSGTVNFSGTDTNPKNDSATVSIQAK